MDIILKWNWWMEMIYSTDLQIFLNLIGNKKMQIYALLECQFC